MAYQYIDLDCLNAIADGDHEFKIEIINKYLEKTPIYIAAIQSSLDKQDRDALFLDVHRFKGSVMFICRDILVSVTKELEQATKTSRDMAVLSDMFQQVRHMSALADEELKHVLVLVEQEKAAGE